MANKKCRLLVKIGNRVRQCYLRHNNVNKNLIINDSYDKFTFTINPTPAGSSVKLYAPGHTQVGNSISVPYGTSVRYIVAYEGYVTQTDTVSVTADTTLPIELEEITYPIDVTDYNYTNINKHLRLTEYIGNGPDVVVPNISEI